MSYEMYIKEGLKAQGLPAKDEDIPYIQDTLSNINEAQKELKNFPELKEELPIKSVDKGVLNDD